MTVKRVAISTGGGDCPGLNAVIRALVQAGVTGYGWELLGVADAYHGLMEPERVAPHRNQWLGLREVRDLIARGGTILGTSNRNDPFHYVRDGVERDVSDQLIEQLRALELDAVVAIGGDGSQRIAQRLYEKGVNIVGVPKTIDNDLMATDATFGFDTAVSIATEALDRIRDTAESHDRVMIVEVMGRDTGWIALHAGIAGAADAILIPEIPYSVEALVAHMKKKRGALPTYGAVIVVAEGARPVDGETSVVAARPGEMPRFIGCAQRLAANLAPHVADDIRVTVLGHVQRGGRPTTGDRLLATRFGEAAARLVAAEKWGRMVALRDGNIVDVPIAEATRGQKRVDPGGELVRAARALGVSFGD